MTANGTRTADFIILGAGVMGTSIAFHLAQRDAGRIVILDKDHVGHGGSGRSSALIRMHYSFPAEVQMALLSLRMFERWEELVGETSLFQKTGFVRIVHHNETERLKRNVEMQRGLGVNVELISRDQLRELEPDWSVEDVELAAYEADSGYGDGAAVASDFLARARDLEACYFPKTEVTAFIGEAGRISGVKTNHGEIHAPRVIAATGPWTRSLFRQIDYEVPIEPEYHQVAILKKPADMRSACGCIDSGSQTYFRADGHDKFLVGDFYERGQSIRTIFRNAVPMSHWKY